jgi:predicted RND superfamily exporter protein/lauroyl/myristoyl acyltransferase
MIVSRRWLYLLLAALFVAGVLRLRFDVEVLDLLPTQLKVVEGLKIYQKHFSNNRELIIGLRSGEGQVSEAAAQSLASALQSHSNLVETVRWRPVWFEDPTLSAELLACVWFNQPPADFRALADRLTPTNLPNVLASAKERLATSFSPTDLARLAYDPFGLTDLPEATTAQIPAAMRDQNWFASEDGTYHVIFVEARPSLANYTDCIKWVNEIQGIAAAWKGSQTNFSGVSVSYTGPPAFVAESAQSMRNDMIVSLLATMFLIGLLFWLAYRTWIPLFWLLALLTFILAGTLALGGLVLGTLNVISLGFADILLGIVVDYALVLYQARLANPSLDAAGARRKVFSGILWAAATTGSAFLMLRISGFPGLQQLGTLVAIGILLGATVMLGLFLKPIEGKTKRLPAPPAALSRPGFAWGCAIALCALIAVGWIYRRPVLDSSGEALQPVNSQAYAGLKEMERELNNSQEPFLVLTKGRDETAVLHRLEAADAALSRAQSNKEISSYVLPLLLWPRVDAQAVNRETARLLIERKPDLDRAAVAAGFSTNALVLTDALLGIWDRAARSSNVFWPTNELSRWILQRVVARDTNGLIAMGPVYPRAGTTPADVPALDRQLPQEDTWLTGWQPLAGELLRTMMTRVMWMTAAVLGALVLALWLAFRHAGEVALSFFTLGFSGLTLCAIMQLTGQTWNLLNIMGVPLLLGAGVDYTILMQLALRRHRGDIPAAQREIGMALVLSGATMAIGFGSLAWASNAGLASLGRVCCIGVCATAFIAVFLLPAWWSRIFGREMAALNDGSSSGGGGADITGPSRSYRAWPWKLGMMAAKNLSPDLLRAFARFCGAVWWAVQPARREIVIRNLLPVFGGDRAKAEAASVRLFRNFGEKLADLWLCETGFSVEKMVCDLAGAKNLTLAQQGKRGALLITPHLGNWEVGGYLLAARGMKLSVVTLAEPGAGFTQLRQQSRARHGIETIVVGEDWFSFVEIIKRLQEGATIALLVDRPPKGAGATEVRLFDQPFLAAIAAAELARASGCALVPVALPKVETGYRVEILPEIPYDRAILADRAARHQLTQRIMDVFAPLIRDYADQWYHFVPMWDVKK